MTLYESNIKTINTTQEQVFNTLKDLNNISQIQYEEHLLPEMIKDLQYDTNSCNFTIIGFGKMGLRITERQPNTTIKLVSVATPFECTVWVKIGMLPNNETSLQISLQADLPPIIKMMADKQIEKGLDDVVEILALNLNNNFYEHGN